jgi:DNA polymerase-1
MTYLLLDADMACMTACTKHQKDVQWSTDIWTWSCDIAAARDEYKGMLNDLREQFNVDYDEIHECWTTGSFFRKEIYPEYKGNRKATRKPPGYLALKKELLQSDMASVHDMIEADDMIGIMATEMLCDNADYVIISNDKDLNQIQGRHYWFTNDEEHFVGLREAEQNFWTQVIAGDSTDNVPGCPTLGKVRAERAVAEFDLSRPMECWKKVVQLYREKGKVEQPHAAALTTARLTRILRTGEYDFATKEVKLWNPPIHLSA